MVLYSSPATAARCICASCRARLGNTCSRNVCFSKALPTPTLHSASQMELSCMPLFPEGTSEPDLNSCNRKVRCQHYIILIGTLFSATLATLAPTCLLNTVTWGNSTKQWHLSLGCCHCVAKLTYTLWFSEGTCDAQLR